MHGKHVSFIVSVTEKLAGPIIGLESCLTVKNMHLDKFTVP